jgi:hypothetical protein
LMLCLKVFFESLTQTGLEKERKNNDFVTFIEGPKPIKG